MFKEDEEMVKSHIQNWHAAVVSGFDELSHPDYIKIVVDNHNENLGIKHMTQDQPFEKEDYDSYYSTFLPQIRMIKKERKRKVQSILENIQVEELEGKAKDINVNDPSEAEYAHS